MKYFHHQIFLSIFTNFQKDSVIRLPQVGLIAGDSCLTYLQSEYNPLTIK